MSAPPPRRVAPQFARATRLWPALLAVLLVGATACERLPTPAARAQAVQPGAVPLRVVQAGGSVLTFVPVTIQGQGPYSFVLDTGASRSVVDQQIAQQLQLAPVPSVVQGRSATGAIQAAVVRVGDWRLGEVDLPDTMLIAIDLQQSDAPALRGLIGEGFHGLLGSDVLSHFAAVTVDYERETLLLGRRE